MYSNFAYLGSGLIDKFDAGEHVIIIKITRRYYNKINDYCLFYEPMRIRALSGNTSGKIVTEPLFSPSYYPTEHGFLSCESAYNEALESLMDNYHSYNNDELSEITAVMNVGDILSDSDKPKPIDE